VAANSDNDDDSGTADAAALRSVGVNGFVARMLIVLFPFFSFSFSGERG
jgi:hypothetical protein